MRHTTVPSILAALLLGTPLAQATPPASAYAGQEKRAIKALSADEVQSLLAGKGLGLARAAELNGYAGPAHVLELSAALALTPEQQAQTQALFTAMERQAIPLGHALVEAERALDQLFASQAITPELLTQSLQTIGTLQAQVRAAHLQAHLAQVKILSAEQNAHYAQLRGYSGASANASSSATGSAGAPLAHPHSPLH
ncbi:MAG: periplasmic heavy metal sensor [Rhodoferax sp.]